MSVLQHIAWAQRNGKHELTTYLQRGGLPPVIGEWALAGAVKLTAATLLAAPLVVTVVPHGMCN